MSYYDKRRAAAALVLAMFAPAPIVAQTASTFTGSSSGNNAPLTAAALNSAFGTKADANGGVLTNPTINGAITSPVLIRMTPDTSYAPFGSIGLTVATPGYQSSIMGYIYNGLPANSPNLSAGLNGYCKEASAGSACFGVYGLSELTAARGTGVASEFTARNFCGAPDTNLPPNQSIGTSSCVSNAMQITAGGTYTSSIGMVMGKEGGSSVGFNTDIYMKGDYGQYALFIDAPTTGNQTAAVIQNNGNGINLQLGTTAAMQPNNAVITVLDSTSTSRFSIRQNGDVYGNSLNTIGLKMNGTTVFTTPIPTSMGTNTVIGALSGINLSSGAVETTILGDSAGGSSGAGMTGAENTLLGWHAGNIMTSGAFNTAVGVNAMGTGVTTGGNNTAIGTDAMRDSTGNYVTALGFAAIRDGTYFNTVALGNNALFGPGSANGSSLVAIGSNAMGGGAITTPSNDVVIGTNAGYLMTSSSNSVFIGASAGASATTSLNNVLIGINAGNKLVTNSSSTIVGAFAGAVATGGNNALFGDYAGTLITSGTLNTIIGHQVGSTTLTTGSDNILIGVSNATDTAAAGTSDTLLIQGNGSTATISATGTNTSAPAVTMPGTLSVVGVYKSGATSGVSCTAGTVNLATMVITNGIVTHC